MIQKASQNFTTYRNQDVLHRCENTNTKTNRLLLVVQPGARCRCWTAEATRTINGGLLSLQDWRQRIQDSDDLFKSKRRENFLISALTLERWS